MSPSSDARCPCPVEARRCPGGERFLHDPPEAVQRHRWTLRIEQWVVDNASTDGSVRMIRHDFPDAQLVVNQENLGPGRARNQVIPRCRGRYILIIDSD